MTAVACSRAVRIAAVKADRSSSSVTLGFRAGIPPGQRDPRPVVPVHDRLQGGDALLEAFPQRGGRQRAGDFLTELGDLGLEPGDMGVGAGDVRAGRMAPVDRRLQIPPGPAGRSG